MKIPSILWMNILKKNLNLFIYDLKQHLKVWHIKRIYIHVYFIL